MTSDASPRPRSLWSRVTRTEASGLPLTRRLRAGTDAGRPFDAHADSGHQRKEPPMKRRSYIPFIALSAAVFVVGLVLGAGKSADDTSAANTASKLLLTIGLLALAVRAVLEVVSRRRARRTATEARQVR